MYMHNMYMYMYMYMLLYMHMCLLLMLYKLPIYQDWVRAIFTRGCDINLFF